MYANWKLSSQFPVQHTAITHTVLASFPLAPQKKTETISYCSIFKDEGQDSRHDLDGHNH